MVLIILKVQREVYFSNYSKKVTDFNNFVRWDFPITKDCLLYIVFGYILFLNIGIYTVFYFKIYVE